MVAVEGVVVVEVEAVIGAAAKYELMELLKSDLKSAKIRSDIGEGR